MNERINDKIIEIEKYVEEFLESIGRLKEK